MGSNITPPKKKKSANPPIGKGMDKWPHTPTQPCNITEKGAE